MENSGEKIKNPDLYSLGKENIGRFQQPAFRAKQSAQNEGIKELAIQFGLSTTAHGFPHFTAAKTIVSKLIWLIIIAGAFGGFGWQLSGLIKKLLSYPLTYEVKVGFQELSFPSVTICNLNAIRTSMLTEGSDEFLSILGFDRDELLNDTAEDTYFDFGTDDFELSDGYVWYDDNEEFFDSYDYDYEQELNYTLAIAKLTTAERELMGHQRSDLIQECAFAGKKCSPKNFTLSQNGKYGNCFTFNNGQNGSSILSTKRPGPNYGLQLTLFIEQDEYLEGYTPGAGAVVVIHDHKVSPFPQDEGIYATPGQATSIGVQLRIITRQKEPWGNCTDGEGVELLYPEEYSVQACEKSCYQKLLKEHCSCADATLPYEANDTLCQGGGTTMKNCFNDVIEKYEDDVYECNCKQACNDKVYSKTVSSAQWPAATYEDQIYSKLSKQSEKIQDQLGGEAESRENLLRINVFYTELNYEIINELQGYGILELFSDLGGLLGLWIGVSIITCAEVIQFIGTLIYLAIIKKKTNSEVDVIH